MLNFLICIGQPVWFEGDINILDIDKFGFFEVDIKSPDYLKHPILQTKVETISGLRTISPLGEWKDWLFSEEILNAQKLGYIINIRKGYLFERGNIFNDYVSDLYKN